MIATTLRSRLAGLAGRVTTPLLPSDYLDAIDPLLSSARLRGRIVAIHPETRDATTLVIKPGRGWRRHVPGQYLRLGVAVDGVRQWRTYSLTSRTNRADGCVSIAVKAVPGGLVSTHLVRHATVGTIVELGQAAGDFTLGTPPAKILFVTAGSGITPVMGMLRNLGAADGTDIVLVHSAPDAGDVIFGAELRTLADRGRIRLVENHTKADGRLDPARIADLVDDLADRRTWACGPTELLDGLEKHWAGAGMADRLHTERFRSNLIATGDGGTVTFSATGTAVEADGTQSLLDAGESAGVIMPSGCRMGICFGCVAHLRRGAVRDLRSGDLTIAADGDGVAIQTCISGAAGDCDIEL
jgi:ferredoxin-NADP reductase